MTINLKLLDTTPQLDLEWFPVLMLHRVVDDVPLGNPYNLCITPRGLERTIGFLRGNGYDIVSLDDAVAAWKRGEPLANKACLTFDDGYEDFYTHAYPVLQRQSCPATVFLVSDRLGEANAWDAYSGLPAARLMSREQVLELAQAGIGFGSHSATHQRLTLLSPSERRYELEGSKHSLEALLQREVRLFAYPYLDQDESLQRDVHRAGYEAAACGEQDAHRPLLLHRVDLRRLDSLSMRFRLMGWRYRMQKLHGAQTARRLMHAAKGASGRPATK